MHISREDATWLMGSGPQVFWIAGADGKISFLSERFADLTGLDATEVVANDRWKEVIYADDMPSLEALWRSARAGASESRSYFRMRFRSGRYHWMHSVGRPVLSPQTGAITHWIGGLVDVDAELRAQQPVQEMVRELDLRIGTETDETTRLHWRFRSLFHDRNIGVFEIDLTDVKLGLDAVRRTGIDDPPHFFDNDPAALEDLVSRVRHVEMNPALVRMLGFDEADARAIGHADLLNRLGRRNPVGLAVRALVEGDGALEGVTELGTPTGDRLAAAFGINISKDGTGYVTLVDVTEQQRAAEMQITIQSELARANRAATIGALSASIAHELNQPITSMRIELRSLQRSISALPVKPGPIQAGIDRVTRQCERLTHIVQQTRDRLMDQRRRVELVDIAALAEAIPLLLQRKIEDARVNFEVERQDAPCPVQADPVEIQQVLVNLTLNAIEAIEVAAPKTRSIKMSIDQAGSFARVRVVDSGCGIEEANLQKIFDPFFTTKSGGVGMGLPICRTIIEALGGDVQAHTIANGRTLFEFSIPNDAEHLQI